MYLPCHCLSSNLQILKQMTYQYATVLLLKQKSLVIKVFGTNLAKNRRHVENFMLILNFSKSFAFCVFGMFHKRAPTVLEK